MTVTMATMHARWWVQANIIAHTLAHSNEGELALSMFKLLDDLDQLWRGQFGYEYIVEVEGYPTVSTEKQKPNTDNIIQFKPKEKL